MATSTLIQRLEAGETGVSNRSQTETFLAGGAIAKGDWVALDTSKTGADKALYVVEAAGVATVGQANVMGVALEAATSGDTKPHAENLGIVSFFSGCYFW